MIHLKGYVWKQHKTLSKGAIGLHEWLYFKRRVIQAAEKNSKKAIALNIIVLRKFKKIKTFTQLKVKKEYIFSSW